MKREELEPLNLSKDQIDQIMGLQGVAINKIKADIFEVDTQYADLKKQYDDTTRQLEEYQALELDQYQKSIDEYQAKVKQIDHDTQAEIERMSFDTELTSVLKQSKARNHEAVKALLDPSLLSYDASSGSILGLQAQLDKIKAENDYLFESEIKLPNFAGKTSGYRTPSNEDRITTQARIAAGLIKNE